MSPRRMTTGVSKGDLEKIKGDLHFINLLTQIAREENLRIVISGGYAVDGSLGKITRLHKDIDIQVYGTNSDGGSIIQNLVNSIKRQISSLSRLQIEDKGRGKFYHTFVAKDKNFYADIYYIQVADNPFLKKKVVVKKDGGHTAPHYFETNTVNLGGITFEAQSPVIELADRVYKRNIRGDEPKPEHDKDIANLREIVSPEELKKILDSYKR